MKHLILVLICIALVAGRAYANEATYEKALAKGMAQIDAGNFRQAVAEFQSALIEKPEDPEATLFLGIALSRANSTQAESTLKRALSFEPTNPLTNLELGNYYLNGGVYTEAEDYFENLLTIAPGTDYARRAQEYLLKIQELKKEKRWSVKFLAGMQYDTNVILNADNNPLPQEISRKSDWRGLINPGFTFSPIRGDSGELQLSYSLYQSLHLRLTDFNVTQNEVELAGKYRLSPLFTTSLGYSFGYVHLGGAPYDYTHTVSPSVAYTSEGGAFGTIFEYRFRKTSFIDSNSEERSGDSHAWGLLQKIAFGSSITSRIGFYHENEFTDSSMWESSSNQVLGGITAALPWDVAIDVNGDFTRKTYPHFDGGRRTDNITNAGISAIKTFAERYSLILSYAYTRNLSTDSLFEYSRDISSLMFNVRY